ncbi:hypothetical protein [Pseudonocardia cypriaca]|uniref:Uncharacterized protein n=1 Tax=Pseudonocardia cypriaca TaxID=882449 RepID=A0A543FSD6_9PSEU|nr:hypothetical protein [Pseudonocardia cypriaca]TQM36711.1 hypothetical protein FB388_3896 [Pseudonocardia cypriaca]
MEPVLRLQMEAPSDDGVGAQLSTISAVPLTCGSTWSVLFCLVEEPEGP